MTARWFCASAVAEEGAEATVIDDPGTVSVISTGVTRKLEITLTALAGLESAGIGARLVTATSGRESVHVAAVRIHDAVRVTDYRPGRGLGRETSAREELS